MTAENNGDTGESVDRATDGGAEASGGPSAVETHEFTDVQAEVDEVEFEELLEDPAYIDFLESIGQLTMPDDDVTLDELVEVLPNDAVVPDGVADASTNSAGTPRSKAVDAIVDALESDEVSQAQRAALRKALGLESRKRTEVQLNHLKSRFLDLEAYIEAMEDFFDRNQTPLDELEDHRSAIESLEDELETLNDRLEDVEGTLERVAADRETDTERLAELERTLEQTRGTLQRNFAVIETELQAAKRWRTRVGEAAQESESEGNDLDPVDASPDHD